MVHELCTLNVNCDNHVVQNPCYLLMVYNDADWQICLCEKRTIRASQQTYEFHIPVPALEEGGCSEHIVAHLIG
jgi:hypothetical protein